MSTFVSPTARISGRDVTFEVATVLGVPALFGVLETLQLLARTAGADSWLPPGQAFLQTIPRWLLFAPLAFAVRPVVRRFPIGARPSWRTIGAHVAAALLFAGVHLAACVVVYGYLLDGAPNQVTLRLTRLLSGYLAADLVAYAAIASLWSAAFHAHTARERSLAEARLRASFERARLDGLRSQLQPHFLFNALNAAHVLARRGDAPAVAAMLESLAALLRTSLDDALPHEIPLTREIELLAPYLEIQRVRFADRVRVRVEIPPELGGALVPTLILQPLVENAFEHGFAARPEATEIRILASRMPQALALRVEDDGPGFAGSGAARPGGRGLSNCRERLHILYGNAASLEIGDSPSGGASVTVAIPLRTGEP